LVYLVPEVFVRLHATVCSAENCFLAQKSSRSCHPFRRGYLRAKAQAFTASVAYGDFDACVRELEKRNAFRESAEARLILSAKR
jgi:hypothetical protein